jgi:hypothetical protein
MEVRHGRQGTLWYAEVGLDVDFEDSGWLREGPDLETDFGGEEGEGGERCSHRRSDVIVVCSIREVVVDVESGSQNRR